MDNLNQARCNAMAKELYDRSHKRRGVKAPAELFEKSY